MRENKYVVAAIGEWNQSLFEENSPSLSGEWYFCSTPYELNELLAKQKPRFIFFPHWRWIVPQSILDNFECVCFHMTDVPYGRGGSPLQNLIVRGHKKTMLTALRMEESLDTGPVYYKRELDLEGAAYVIYQKASALTWKMIKELVQSEPVPTPQIGESVTFKRRKVDESKIPSQLSLEQIYDYIRMLDAPDYPKAFLESENYHLIFHDARFLGGTLSAKVNISIKEK